MRALLEGRVTADRDRRSYSHHIRVTPLLVREPPQGLGHRSVNVGPSVERVAQKVQQRLQALPTFHPHLKLPHHITAQRVRCSVSGYVVTCLPACPAT